MLQIKNLEFSYKKGKTLTLDDISVNFKQGEFYAVLGNNGSGKSTLLKCINGLCFNNNIFIKNKNLNELSQLQRSKNISFCPQNQTPNTLSVYDNVMIGRLPYIKFQPNIKDKEIVEDTLKIFDLYEQKYRKACDLSGGELQRMNIARNFAQDTPYMLFDEPTNNLDINLQHKLMQFFKKQASELNKCIIAVLHDINLSLNYANKLIFLKDGRIVSVCKPSDVNEGLLEKIYNINLKIYPINNSKFVSI